MKKCVARLKSQPTEGSIGISFIQCVLSKCQFLLGCWRTLTWSSQSHHSVDQLKLFWQNMNNFSNLWIMSIPEFENIPLSVFCPFMRGISHKVCFLECVETSENCAKDNLCVYSHNIQAFVMLCPPAAIHGMCDVWLSWGNMMWHSARCRVQAQDAIKVKRCWSCRQVFPQFYSQITSLL